MDVNNTKEVNEIIHIAFARASWLHDSIPFAFTAQENGGTNQQGTDQKPITNNKNNSLK